MGNDGEMRPTFAEGKRTAISKLLELRRQAQKDKEPRVVLRIQGVLMSLEGQTTGEISHHLTDLPFAPRRNFPDNCVM